ncbi:MAG TPA: hypothetical protein VHD62_05890 [Opitutaceae bacterium]|nr:hypothetical protein [Opitutaceae bacterium]
MPDPRDDSSAAPTRLAFGDVVSRALNLVATAIGVGCLLVLLEKHATMLAYPGPQEINEPATWHQTYLLSCGRNPFTADELPGSTQFFGPLYSYVVLALKPLFGSGYVGHRFVNFLCIVASLWLVGAAMRRRGASLGVIFTSLSVLYWIVLDNIMVTARPDALGWLLFLVGLLVPAACDYALGAALLGLVCAVLAFQCKAYFALAGCATLLGVASLRSWRAALALAAGYFGAIAGSVALMTHFFPMYFLEVFLMQRNMVIGNSDPEIGWRHTLLLLQRGGPFFALLLAGLFFWLRGAGAARWRSWRAGEISAAQFLRPASSTEILALVLLVHLALVQAYMGFNGGASFTYHVQLLFPLLLVLGAAALRTAWLQRAALAGLAVFALASWHVRWQPTDSTSYQRICDLIRLEHGEVFALPAAAEPLELNTKRVYDDGFAAFVNYALVDGLPDRLATARAIERRCNEQRAEIAAKIAARTFHLVLTEEDHSQWCDIELLKAHYDVVEKFDMPTYFGHGPVWVWRPKAAG